MIENFYLDEWRQQVPWPPLYQVEQDLVISRALVNLYERPAIANSLLFRGGTALNKLYFQPPQRYSEDIDLVQNKAGPIGPIINEIRQALDNWLGEPKRKLTERSAKLIYSYISQENRPSKLKIEINTTEHFLADIIVPYEFSVKSRWFTGNAQLQTYSLDELMATKLRALYQRRKGRDLFDMWLVLTNNRINCRKLIDIFQAYCQYNNELISRALFEKNLHEKSLHADFQSDIRPLLTNSLEYDFHEAIQLVHSQLISLLPGTPWKKPKEK